jgi:zinc protease
MHEVFPSADPSHDIPALPTGVQVVTLDNGLTLILREDRSAPVVSAQVWCKSGSIHEGEWLGAGLSHLLEHMLFKGTSRRPASRIDQEVQEAGGYMNAYTSFDRTVYHIDLPSSGTRIALDILCDIVQNATLPEAELTKELDVIRREMDMAQDDPHRRSSRRLFETAYVRSPYRLPIIGLPDIFNELRREDIVGYYRGRYAPNNLFFVVVGDIQSEEVIAQIREGFSTTKARPLPPLLIPSEPRQMAAREVIEEAAIELGHLHYCWHIPDIHHPDIPALDVIATLLGNGRSSRLYQAVREKKGLAHSADAWVYSPGNTGLFGLSAMLDPDKFQPACDALLIELARLREELVPAADLAKVIKQFVAGTLASRRTMAGQAQDLGGNWNAANDLNFSARYLAAAKRVTPTDIRRVARHYLTSDNHTLYALLPNGTAPKKAFTAEVLTEHPIQKFTLANGLRLLVKENHRLPFIEFRAVFQGGSLIETTANNGITQLMARLLIKGTSRRAAEQIAAEIESVGGSLDSYSGNQSFGINAEVLREDFALGLDLLADVILNPTFPAAAIEREREVQLAGLKAQKDHLLQSAFRLMRRRLYGETAYGLDPHGSAASVAQLQFADLTAFHCRLVVPNNCVLAIYGDVDPQTTRAAVEKILGRWPAGETPAVPPPAAMPTALQHVREMRDKKQAVVVLGLPGVALDSPDRFALELIQESCSDLGSRLFLRIREELGLAYYVGAQNFEGLIPGFFAFYAGTAPEQAAQVEQELLAEVNALREQGLTEAELKRAKAKVIGQKKIAQQDLGSLAMETALDELYGLGHANTDDEVGRFEAVTLEQARAVARKYLRPDSAVVAILQPKNGTEQK